MLPAEIEELITRLEAAPARYQSALARLEDADSVASDSAGSDWSPAQVLAHVRASNDILEPRIFHILVRDDAPLISFDEERWLEVSRYESLPLTESLAAMRLRRRELTRILRALSPDEWARVGNHETRGRMSVLDVSGYIADHDEEHIAQIERAGELAGTERG